MTKDEYEERVRSANIAHDRVLDGIARTCAEINNDKVIGDLFTDHIGTIKIEKMTTCILMNGFPVMKYFGACRSKNGEPQKSGKKRNAFQSNEIKK